MSFTYKGLKERLDRHLVTEEEVSHQLQRLRDQHPRIAVVEDRPTENGDEIVLDYAGFCDGVRFEGGTAQNQTLVLGSGTFIPGFEEQLLDKVPGEEVEVFVTFPEAYHAPELAGKEARFDCVIRQIRVKTAYELDDTFAQEVGRCENMEQLRQRLTESMQDYVDRRGEMDLQDRLIRRAAATLELELSEEEVAAGVEEQMQTLQAQLAQQGLSIEMYCQFMSTTEAQLREDSRAEAEAMLRIRATVKKVAELENLKAEQAEIDEACEMICQQNGITMEQLKGHYDEEFEQAVIHSVLTSKVMHLIREAAVLEGV